MDPGFLHKCEYHEIKDSVFWVIYDFFFYKT